MQASWVIGSSGMPSELNALPCSECEWAAATTSGRASWIAEWMTNAARFTAWVPYTTSPEWLTRRRSLTRMWRKLMPNGLTQKWSGNSGSRTVMWPATPSPKPKRPKMRSAPASFCLRWSRSSSTVANVGGPVSDTSLAVSSMPSIVGVPVSVIAMTKGYFGVLPEESGTGSTETPSARATLIIAASDVTSSASSCSARAIAPQSASETAQRVRW